MPTTTAKAGKYELLVDRFEQDNDDKTTTVYGKGDIVTLSAEEADRLTTCEPPAVAEPGSIAQAHADRLQAEADEAKARADEAKARAADASKEATTAPKAPAAR